MNIDIAVAIAVLAENGLAKNSFDKVLAKCKLVEIMLADCGHTKIMPTTYLC